MIFAVTDIETTGGYANGNSITEIAIVLTDGVKILDTFSSFVQPATPIPAYITQLTGITNEMVEGAPTFSDLVDELESFFADHIFVAHNVGFDYSFIKKHYEQLNLRFNKNKLCTVRLARALYPGLPSYSLANLCTHFQIENHAPHRALGDTMATVALFHQLVQADNSGVIAQTLKKGSGEQWLPPQLPADKFHQLPEKPGVYYLLDSKGKPLYIGMSVNIKKRIRQHFGGTMQSRRRQEFLRSVTDIDYVLCGSELVALLLEDQEIRKHWPPFNKAQKAPALKHAVVMYQDQEGYNRLGIQSGRHVQGSIKKFHSAMKARNWLQKFASANDLHPALCGLPVLVSQALPNVNDYNNKLQDALELEGEEGDSLLIIGPGRDWNEQSVVWISEGVYQGFGFIEQDQYISEPEQIEDYIQRAPSSVTTDAIIRSLLERPEKRQSYTIKEIKKKGPQMRSV